MRLCPIRSLTQRLLWFALMSCLTLGSVFGSTAVPFHTVIYELPAVAKGESLADFTYIWEDPTGKATLNDASRALRAGEFQAPSGNLNQGFTSSTFWFYVGLNNPSGIQRELIIENDYPILDTIGVYCNIGYKQIHFLLGDHISKSARLIDVRNYLIPIELQPKQSASCFFKVSSSSNVTLPLSVSDTYSYVEKVHDSQWLFGGFYGVTFGLCFFGFVLYVALRESMYLFFTLHGLGVILFNSGFDGTAASFWQPLGLNDAGMLISVAVAELGALYFALSFLDVKTKHPRIYKTSHGLALVILAYLCLMPFVETRVISQFIAASGLLILVFILFLGLRGLQDKYSPAKLFILAWSPVFFAVMLVVLNILGVLQDSALSIYGMKTVWCLELLLLAVGLGWQVNHLKSQKVGVQQEILHAKKESIDKTQFLAKISHEVRGPMSGILGLSELLRNTPLNTEQQRYVKAIRNGSHALMEVTNDFLEYSKIEAGKMSLNIHAFNMKELIQDCAAIYEMAARKKGLKLVCIFEIGTPVVVQGDERRVRQVLLNLISNALKYTEVGYIKIRIGLTDQILDQQIVLKITVEDTGVGIDKSDLEQLFQNYGRIDQPVHGAEMSTGLGLVISRQLVELMGGEIQLSSEPGSGSSFWFTLPVSIKDDYQYLDHEEIYNLITPVDNDVTVPIEYSQSTKHQSDAELKRVASKPVIAAGPAHQTMPFDHQLSIELRILVVEDNDINLKVIRGFLDKLGLNPVTLTNGLEAVEHITDEGNQYDLILMDCEMPIMDGYSAAQKIHQWQQQRSMELTPIIALSAHATDLHIQKASEAGMAMHISKPLTFEKFVDAIEAVMV